MKRKRYTLFAIAAIMALSFTLPLNNNTEVKAQTTKNNLPSVEQKSDMKEIKTVNEELAKAMIQFKSNDFSKVKIMNDENYFMAAGGDSYEANNGPAVATDGRYNQITYATIHNADDVDWYRIQISDISKPISLILTNIPSRCDYDMYLVKYDDVNGISAIYYNLQTGNTSETLYGSVAEAGTYYVVIQPNSSVADNYSDTTYKLYAGDYYRTDQYGYVDTGLDIEFGYIPVGNTTPVYKGWYSYDLTNNPDIPDGSIVRKIYLMDNGNGGSWIGFYKMLAAGGQGIQLEEKIGQITLMYSGDNELLAKQEWLIAGHLIASTYFTWEPDILISYKFPVTISNLRYL